jgi:tetratricopeptide (TPR) repeat protein
MSQGASPTPTALPVDGRIALDATLLKSLRKARGLSQEALADACFQRQLTVSIASVKRAETGHAVLYRTARQLAAFYDVDVDALVAQPDAVAPAVPLPAVPVVSDSAPVRHVIELHIVQSHAPGPDSLSGITRTISQFGGQMRPGRGPALLALFGLPHSYRSDAERSLRCATELARMYRVHGIQALVLQMVRWDDGKQGLLPEGVTGLGGARQTAAAIFVAQPLAFQLASRASFVQGAQRLAGYLQLADAPEPGLPALATPLAGRSGEMRQFSAIVETALENQCGHIAYLRGPAGVGKSRLVQEYAALARRHGFRWHGADIQDTGADSWRAPFEQLARSLFDIEAGLAEPLEQMIDEVIAELHLPAEWNIFYRALAGARMSAEQLSLYAAMSHTVRDHGIANALQMLLLRRAETEPLLISIEDLHWGEQTFFEALAGLLALSREAPIIWVLSSRIEDDPLEKHLRPHLFDVALSTFDLAALGAREAQQLADQFKEVDPALRRRCVERAQGNPLFLTQLLASPGGELPDTLKHLVQARLDAMAPEHRVALRTASVFGNRFELSLLRAVLGDMDYEPEAAGRNSMVRRLAPGQYIFVHDLVMHCIYESIDQDHVRRLHGEVAELYRERDPALSAQHLYRAADPNAFEMMLRAIRDKLVAHQYEDALDLCAQCAAADSTRYSSFALALLKAHATAGMGQMALAKERYEHSLLLAGRPQEKIDAVIGLATALNVLDLLDEEERLINETLPLAHAIQAEASLGKLMYLKGNIYFPRGNYAECRRNHEEAVRYARAAGMAEIEARALSGLGDSYYAEGRMQQAHHFFSECIAMCERHGLLNIEASNRCALGSTRLYLGQAQEAVADAMTSARIAHQVGNRRAEVVARMTAGWVHAATGDVASAMEQATLGLELARTIGSSRFEPFLMETLARAQWLAGDQQAARTTIAAAAELVDRLRLHRYIGPWVLGTLALFTDDPGTRKRALLQGAAHLTRDCLAHNAYRFHLAAAETALLDGDIITAQFHAEQLEAFSADEPCAWSSHHAALIQAHAQGAATETLKRESERLGFTYTAPRLRTSQPP